MRKTINRLILDETLDTVFKKLKPGKVLDLGGANSPYKNKIPSTKYLCVDLNPKHKPDIVGDVHNLKIKGARFDTIIATELLEHCHSPKIVVKEIYRLLKKNGAVVASVPFMYPYHGDNFSKDYWRFSKDGINELFKDFKKVNIYPHGSLTTTVLNFIFCRFFFLTRLSKLFYKIRFGELPAGFVILAVKK
jgi:ubiquinone/menaquinone biosynthesis C-methylase UbiE